MKKVKEKKAKKPHYVDAKVLRQQIIDYYKTDILTDELAINVRKIAEGLSFAPNFINYTYKEDMVSDALESMICALLNKKFNIESTFSPFSYFTTIAFHAFINRIKKEKKHNDTMHQYQEMMYHDAEEHFMNTSNNELGNDEN